MLAIYHDWSEASQDLHYSILSLGYELPYLILEPSGFLPKDSLNPFLAYLGHQGQGGKPLFYNQLPLPDYWEIRGTNQEAQVFDQEVLRALIHYEPNPDNLRILSSVSFLDGKGQVSHQDFYNQWGKRWAQTSYLGGQKAYQTLYYDAKESPVILENHLTGTIILEVPGKKRRVFLNRQDFYLFYLRAVGLDQESFLINHLGQPFFLTRALPHRGRDVLVWQESLADTLPANLEHILTHPEESIKEILVTQEASYQKLLASLPEKGGERLHPFGLFYPFESSSQLRKEVLILTYSDQIPYLEDLYKRLPDWTFHIAAPTEMSPKLLSLVQEDRIRLYPNMSPSQLRDLLRRVTIHLEIQEGGPVGPIFRQAFLHNVINLTFEGQKVASPFQAAAFCLPDGDWQELAVLMEKILASTEAFLEALALQGQAASYWSKEELAAILAPIMDQGGQP